MYLLFVFVFIFPNFPSQLLLHIYDKTIIHALLTTLLTHLNPTFIISQTLIYTFKLLNSHSMDCVLELYRIERVQSTESINYYITPLPQYLEFRMSPYHLTMLQHPPRISQQPSRTPQKPPRTPQQPHRKPLKPTRTLQQPSITLQQLSRTPQQPVQNTLSTIQNT